MNTAQKIQFAWGIGCGHPGCTVRLEQWSPGDGPPYQDFSDAEEAGWVLHPAGRDPDPDLRSWVISYCYHCYCPEHSAAARRWQTDLAAWKKARWEIGKETHTELTLLGRLQEWGARFLGKKIGQTVEGWEQENPRPTPPWETSC